MKLKCLTLLTILSVAFIVIGCSGNNTTPVSPDSDGTDPVMQGTSHYTWGLWQFTADPIAGTLEIVPIRSGEMHVNVLPFLEPPALKNLTLEYLEFSGDQVTADIGLRHPFLGSNEFTGFDVCGILITSGSVSGFDDPDLVMAGAGDTRLLNPDGFTRWWNPDEFPVNLGTMFSYNDGLLGTPHSVGNYNSTLNGYKYYTDGLKPNDGLDTVDPIKRGVFSAGQQNVRRFIIQMDGVLVFNYAIDANWQLPDGQFPWQVPDDFGEGANRPEAWYIEVTETVNTLWNDGDSSGGELSLSIDVYDHFNADMNTVKVESPGNFSITSSNTSVGGGSGYATYEIDITGATPAPDSIDLFITVECEKSGFGGLLPGKTQAVYFTGTASVLDKPPMTGIFVDGDNAGDPDEDGSMGHPFDTIQEGLDAAHSSEDEQVVVDQASDPYSPFTLYDNSYVLGYNWNDGVGWPTVEHVNSNKYGDNVNDVTIEGLLFDCDMNSSSSSPLRGILFTACDGLTITECKFTGIITYARVQLLYFDQTSNTEISYCEFTDIFHRGPETSYRTYNIIRGYKVDGFSIHHNEFHHIGFDVPDDGVAGTNSNIIDANRSLDVDFHNLLIYDIFAKTSCVRPAPVDIQQAMSILGTGNVNNPDWDGCFKLYNLTIDDIRHADPPATTTVNAGHVNAMYAFWVGGDELIWKNNIVSNIIPTDDWVVYGNTSYYGWWIDGAIMGGSPPNASPYPMDYSLVYNVGKPLPPGENWSTGWFYGWANRIMKGTGCYGNNEDVDPQYDMTPGENFYHPTNSLIATGADDGSEMGAFGGPYGDWTPPSQE